MISINRTPSVHASRDVNVHIGAISVFALIIILSMAVLAVLTVSTAHSSLVLSQRQAAATQELYLNETAAQTFVAQLDDALSSGPDISDAQLIAMRNAARDAVNGQVEVSASTSERTVYAEFTCPQGRTLRVAIALLDGGEYRIDRWRMTAVENEEQPMGTLYTGA